MLRRLRTHLQHRAPALLFVAVAAWLVHRRSPSPPAPTLEGVAAMLSAAAGAEVKPAELVWERSGGPLADALWGRRVLFLASVEGKRDLFRARVRVSREGHPIVVRSVSNVTRTDLGDERQLTAQQPYVAFASEASGGISGVTVLDLSGDPMTDLDWRTRGLQRLYNWLRFGSTTGFGRRELIFRSPPSAVRMELRDGQLVLASGDPAEASALTLSDAALNPGPKNSYDADAWAVPYARMPARQLCWESMRERFGTDGVAWVRRLRERWAGSATAGQVTPPTPAGEPVSSANSDAPGWPPAPLSPRLSPALADEGSWQPAADWLPALEGAAAGAEPYLLHTRIRPDPQRPSELVRLVAIDTRQTELRMEAGSAEPQSRTGPRGRGRIDASLLSDTVAAFNGGLPSAAGQYGMVVDRRVLVPAVNGAASVAIDQQGIAYLGSWTYGDNLPQSLVSLRQNLDPLISAGVFRFDGHIDGGETLGADSLSERSALCRTDRGYLIYGWGLELAASTLADALLMAGCRDAIHLDTSPGQVGFALLNARGDTLRSELLDPAMTIVPDRFARASSSDFFYLVLRRFKPTIAADMVSWQPDGGQQPPPAWLPAIYRTRLPRLGAEVDIIAIDTNRFEWHIRPGLDERAGQTSAAPLPPAELARALIAINLGVAARGDNKRGLALNGVLSLPLRPDRAVVTMPADGDGLTLGRVVADMAPPGDASELLLWAEGGELRSESRKLGRARPRSGACQLHDGTMLLATTIFDSGEAIARALTDLGCRRVVALNRGLQLRAEVDRAGTEQPLQAEYTDTMLVGFAAAMRGSARRLAALPR